jgi:hypothetical protein
MQKTPLEFKIYKGVKVRRCNRIVLKVGESIFKKLIDEVENTGLSIPKILAYSSQPCERCKNISVTIFNDNGLEIKITRGILSKRIPDSNGVNIIENSKIRNKIN